ncbi:MAG: transposase [Candidatus Paceibacterota bacterium]|jgi:putative transposase
MNRKIKFSEGEYYHIYNRGIEKRIIFQDRDDYRRFVFLLNMANSKEPLNVRGFKKIHQGLAFANHQGQTLVNIGAWCLMPNHFHLLVGEKIDGGISIFVQKLLTAYSMYFNKKYERKGSLFEGRFQAQHANTDNYLKYLYSYIHLNPVKLIQSDWKEKGIEDIKKTREFLKNYEYSSYLDYLDCEREEKNILGKENFPEYFKTKEDFENNLSDWLKFDPNIININF